MDQIAEFAATVTVGQLILASVGATMAREAAVELLPDRIAGPGGWLVDTSRRR